MCLGLLVSVVNSLKLVLIKIVDVYVGAKKPKMTEIVYLY